MGHQTRVSITLYTLDETQNERRDRQYESARPAGRPQPTLLLPVGREVTRVYTAQGVDILKRENETAKLVAGVERQSN